MDKRLLHTPEGVRDIYDKECSDKLAVQEKIHRLFHLSGYHDIQTPSFEFFDIFNKERGSVASKNMYKFFDREGNTLVLRPDMTPAIARAASKFYMDEIMPLRFCYAGNTFINHSELQGKLKEITQLGVELIGDVSVYADAEVIALTVRGLLEAGVKEFQVSIGHMDYFKGIVDDLGLDPDVESELLRLIEGKNYFGMEELLAPLSIADAHKEALLKLPGLFGQDDALKKASELTENKKSLAAVERLRTLMCLLEEEGLKSYVSFDLGMVSMYHYYTGIVFRAYTYGTGDAVAAGGRYDHLLAQFGKNAAAVGFGLNLDQLLIAMRRQKLEIEGQNREVHVVFAPSAPGARQAAGKFAAHLRAQGICVQVNPQDDSHSAEDYLRYAKQAGADGLYFFGPAAADGVVEVADLGAETWEKVKMEEVIL
ncbi:MAG: ATP phosphoribosyltransferase regulatory subunit [Lachnospiraceae bacterium]|nr:ATP phosphoribosyltransferase regulatory subunit [Lachnospiraceae bacterium]